MSMPISSRVLQPTFDHGIALGVVISAAHLQRKGEAYLSKDLIDGTIKHNGEAMRSNLRTAAEWCWREAQKRGDRASADDFYLVLDLL